MLTPYDDYPVHQTPLPLAHVGGGHPDFYDRFWFNGYTEDAYFAVALAIYPNRGIIDAAFSVVADGVQRSVFASGPVPADRTQTSIGPISIEIIEPLSINRVLVDAPEYGLGADLVFHARTAAYEEPRQILNLESRLLADVTRASQFGTWTGTFNSGDAVWRISDTPMYGTKDRSWGIRAVGLPAPAAPIAGAGQLFFLWAPINFGDLALHYLTFEDAVGKSWVNTGAVLPVIGQHDSTNENGCAEDVPISHAIRWAPGLRRSEAAVLVLDSERWASRVELTPTLTFRMKGAGYFHPQWAHGLWHGGFAVGGEEAPVADLDNLSFDNIHVQQVVSARWGDRTGIGVLEQLVIGPHGSSGFVELLDGAPAL